MAPATIDDDEYLNRFSNNSNDFNQFCNHSHNSNLYKQEENIKCDHYASQNKLKPSVDTQAIRGSSKIFNLLGDKPIATYGTNDNSSTINSNKSKDIERASSGNGSESNEDDIRDGVSSIIGSFGWFQLLVLVFSGLREGLVGYDALVMSIILQPESKFLCAEDLTSLERKSSSLYGHTNYANFSALFSGQFQNYDESTLFNETAQCYRSLNGGRSFLIDSNTNKPVRCNSWIFSNETIESDGPSLVADWSLVCQYHWLVAFIESAYFFGLVTGNLVWGYYADKLGRRPTYLAAHTISLVFGSLAVVAPTISTFAFCRFLSAFGSIGYNIIYSIQVELIGVKHRSFCTIMNHLGWGLGVICVPLVDHLFDDYRPIIAVAPVLTLFMFPWAFWLPESSRWLMANGKFKDARRELLRAASFNGKLISPYLDKRISALEHKIRADKLRQQAKDCNKELIVGNEYYVSKSGKLDKSLAKITRNNVQQKQKQQQACSYGLIFTNRRLFRDTIILSYLAFVGHLFYYVQTINFAYVKNLSTAANFITSGAGEWVSVVVGAILLKLFSRKTCLSLFLFFMTCSFTFQSFIESGVMPELDTKIIITANNGLGTLASLLLVFVTLIVNQEVYPTVVRQTGTSITNTLGESGSTLAPLIIQFSRIVGAWKANLIYSIFCLVAILASRFVTKTDDVELPDT